MKRNGSELKINEPEKNKNQGYSKYEKTWKKKRQHWLGTNGQNIITLIDIFNIIQCL